MKVDESEPVNVINREVVGGTANVTKTIAVEKHSEAEVKYENTTESSLPSTLMDDRDEEAKMSTNVSGGEGTESPNEVPDDTKAAGEDDFDYYDEIRPVTEPSVYDSRLSSASQDRD